MRGRLTNSIVSPGRTAIPVEGEVEKRKARAPASMQHVLRLEERSVGKECGRTCNTALSPDHTKQNHTYTPSAQSHMQSSINIPTLSYINRMALNSSKTSSNN